MLQPYILGSGFSASAVENSLSILQNKSLHLKTAPPLHINREQKLAEAIKEPAKALVFICNPHGLHAERILEANALGVKFIVCEKPVCTNLGQLEALRNVSVPTFLLQVYRQTWGVHTLQKLIEQSELGEVFAIESRYWQSSSAQRALSGKSNPKAWKSDPKTSGGADVLIDLLPHQLDIFAFLLQDFQIKDGFLKKFFVNADSPEFDTHLQLALQFESGVSALGSVSKVVHGASNQLEVNVLGSKGSAQWVFENPDQIVLGRGNRREIISREDKSFGSGFAPYHGMGWLEGYLQIVKGVLTENYVVLPSLAEAVKVMEIIFTLSAKAV